MDNQVSSLRFLNAATAQAIAKQTGTPTFVYSEALLREAAAQALAFPNAFGLTVRYAMKASSNAAILRLLDGLGIHIDASSGFEVLRALRAGIAAERISLSAQQLPDSFDELLATGMRFNACSLNQLQHYGQLRPGTTCGVRFNPGLGSGGTGKTNVGGPHSSFGIWHEWWPQVQAIAEQHQLTITRIHTHIGSGSDPAVWSRTAQLSLDLVKHFPQATTLNLGGGYKVGRMPGEASTDLAVIGQPVKERISELAAETGRQLHLEIEPGTYLVAAAGCLLTTVHDVVTTGGPEGMTFYKIDSGMTEILRPSLYGAQHPVVIVPQNNVSAETENAMVVGHNCESGDIITCAPGEPEKLAPRTFTKAQIGDLCVIEMAGAYCASMSAKNYNAFPEAAEVLLGTDGQPRVIRKRQSLEQLLANEVDPE